jgi:hypothetical protein
MKAPQLAPDEAIKYAIVLIAIISALFLMGFYRQRRRLKALEAKFRSMFGNQIFIRLRVWQKEGTSSNRRNQLRASLEIGIPARGLGELSAAAHKTGGLQQKMHSGFNKLVHSIGANAGGKDFAVGEYTLTLQGNQTMIAKLQSVSPETMLGLSSLFALGFRDLRIKDDRISLRAFHDELSNHQPENILRSLPAVLSAVCDHCSK